MYSDSQPESGVLKGIHFSIVLDLGVREQSQGVLKGINFSIILDLGYVSIKRLRISTLVSDIKAKVFVSN